MPQPRTILIAAVLVAGCGGGSSPSSPSSTPSAATEPQRTTAASATAAPTTTPTATTTAAPAPAAQPTTTAPAPRTGTDCEALGMTRAKGREGPCTHGALSVYVANRGTTVRLDEMSVRLNGVGLLPAAGSRVEADVSLTVSNRLHRPAAFDASGNQAVLNLGGRRYLEKQASGGVGIAPGRSVTVPLVFEIPRRAARLLATVGDVAVTQFTDTGRAVPRRRIAILRTYR